MKNIFTQLLVSVLLIISFSEVSAQCILKPGALSFTGTNFNDDGNDGSQQDDAFSFIIMQDLSPGFEIFFTDLGWLSSGGFQLADQALSDGIIKWTVPAEGVELGQEVTIFAKYGLSATLGTVEGVRETQISGIYMDLGIVGDQLFAFTGTVANPELIAGISIQTGWNSLDVYEFTSSNSSLPATIDQLGIQHTELNTTSSSRIASAVLTDDPLSGDFIALNNLLNLPSSWLLDSSVNPGETPTEFQLPVNKTFVVSSFEYLNAPSGPSNLVYGETATLEVALVDSRNIASYQWEFGTDQFNFSPLADGENFLGTQNSSLDISGLSVSLGTVYFRVTTVDACGNEITSPIKELTLLPTTLTPQLSGAITKEYDGNTNVSVSNTNLDLQGSIVSGDEVGLVVPVAGNFEQPGIGTNLDVTVTGLTLTGADKDNYQLSGTSVTAAVGEIVDTTPPTISSIEIPEPGYYATGDQLEITLELSEDVQVDTGSGVPGLTLQIGEESKEASYVSGDNSASLLFSYTIEKDLLDSDGIDLIGMSLNAGRIVDQANLNLDLTLPTVSTVDIKVDALAPDGYTIANSVADINATNQNAYRFPMVDLELGATISYEFLMTSSPFSIVFDGSDLVLATTQDVGNNGSEIDFSAIADGEYTIVAFLTDSLGNVGTGVSRTVKKDVAAPSGYSIRFDKPYYNLSNSTGSVIVDNAEVNSTYQLVVTSSGDGNSQTIERGPVTITETTVNIPLAFNSLDDGDLTASLYLVDESGNQGEAVEATAILDLTPPSDYTVSILPDLINGPNQDNFSFELINGEIGADYSFEISSSEGGTPVEGTGTVNNASQTIDNIDVSTLPDGELTLTLILTDVAGNEGEEAIDQVEKDLSGVLTIQKIQDATEDDVDGEFELILNNPMTEATDVEFIISGSAAEGVDFETIGATVNIPANTTTVSIPVNLIADDDVENEEAVTISLIETNNPLISIGTPDQAQLTITDNDTPTELTIIPVSGLMKTYGTTDPEFTFSVSGLRPGDDRSIVTGQLDREPGEDAGSYAYTLENLDAGPNYTLTLSPGIFTIQQAFLTTQITANQGKVYGEEDPELEYTVTGFVNEDDESIISGELYRDTGENVGNYLIKGDNLDAGINYIILAIPKFFEITPATLTIMADAGQNKIYGDADPSFTYEANGFKSGDSESVLTGALARTDGENIGNYAIHLGSLSAGSNYTIDYLGADFVITEKTLNITVNPNQNKVFGDADPTFTYTATGFERGDDESILTGTLERETGEDIGSYAINLGTLDAGDNYTIVFTGTDFGINPATLTVIADAGQSKEYGDADPIITYTATGFKNGDDESILNGAIARTSGENVGTYPITRGTLSAGDNYKINYTGSDFEINPATLTVIADVGQSKIYGNADPSFTYQATGFENEDDGSILSGELDRETGENVGNYLINQGSLSAGDNYRITYTGADFEITERTLTVIADANQGKVYGQTDPVLTYTASNFGNGDDESILSGSLSRQSGEDIGSYAINLSNLDAAPNYTINFTGADFVITEKTLTITVIPNQSKLYGDADPIFTYAATGFEGGDDESILTGELERKAGENVGGYAINKGDLSAGSNYTIAFIGADFEITPATLSITADGGQSKVYGDSDPIFSFTATGFESGDDESILTGALARTSGENVEAYAIKQGNLSAGDNYSINYTGSDFEINPATLTITADAGQDKIYGNADPVFTYEAAGFKNGDDESTLNGNLARAVGENVGDYQINLGTLSAGDNYTIDYSGVDFAIRERTLTVTADANQGKVFGETHMVLTYTASNFGNGDDESILTGSLSRQSGEDIGVYAITQGSLDAGPNYTINFTGADFVITEKILVITVDAGQSKVYGDLDPTLTYTVTGFESGDDESILTGELERETGENVDNYPITVGTLSAGDNYTIVFNGADFEITPATLTITADAGQDKIYGDADPVFTYEATGFKNGDSESILIGALERPTGENVGDYPINLGTLSTGDNYMIDYTEVDFAIKERTLTVTADANQDKVYGETDPVLTYTASNFGNGDDESIFSGSLRRVVGEAAGIYAITQGNLSAGDNYTVNYTGADFTISEKTLTITVDAGQSKVYGDTDPTFTYTAFGFERDDDASILIGDLERASGEIAGTYAITMGDLSAGNNYIIDFTGADFVITQATLNIIVDTGQNKVYGEADPIFTYIASGFENGDNESIIAGSLTRVTGENVGKYEIKQGDLSAGDNYSITYNGADFEITKRKLTVIAEVNHGKIYGEIDPELTYMASNFENGDDESVFSGSLTRESGEDVGTYTIGLGSLSAGTNYTINFVSAEFTITPATLDITANAGQGKVYGEADPTFTYIATGFENGEDESILSGLLTRESGEAVGTYEIGLGSLSAGANYTIDFTSSDFTITTKILSVAADAGQGKIYGETDPAFTYTVTGFENGDDESILGGLLTREAGEDVGTYEIQLGSLYAGSDYTIDFTNARFEITPATIDGIIFDDASFTFDGSEKNIEITGNLPEGASVTYKNNIRTNIGAQEATATITGPNYSTLILNAKLTITPATITGVTLEDESFVYDGMEKSIEVNGLPEGASVSYDNNGRTNAGIYEVIATVSQENYSDLVLMAELAIEKAEAVITAEAMQTFTYDGEVKNVVASLNHTEAGLTYIPQQGFADVGTYVIEISSEETDNYLATSKEVSLVIENKEIEGLTFEDGSFVYDGTAKSLEVGGLPEGAGVSYTNNDQTNAGSYTVTATISLDNFDDEVLTANLLIDKAPQEISFDEIADRNQQTDDNFQLGATASSGLPVIYSYSFDDETEAPAATVGPRGFVQILGAGTITITATQEGNRNYNTAESVSRTLTIIGSGAKLNNVTINGTMYPKPDQDIYYLMDCGNTGNEVQIQLQLNRGAVADRENEFTLATPVPGIYRETVTVTSEDGNTTSTYTIVVEKNFNFEDIVIQKFDNVLLVNNNPETNGGYRFVSYRWYKDGSVIGNGQYYSVGDDRNDELDTNSEYYLEMETEEGEVLRTCISMVQLRNSYQVSLAPNPVMSGGTMELFADFPKGELETMELSIHNLNGVFLKKMKSKDRTTSITLPHNLQIGVYLLRVETQNISKTLKFIVR